MKILFVYFVKYTPYGYFGVLFTPSPRPKKSHTCIHQTLKRQDVRLVDEFRKECEINKTILHRNVVSMLGTCEAQGKLFLVMEHCSHGSLKDYLEVCLCSKHTSANMCMGVFPEYTHL